MEEQRVFASEQRDQALRFQEVLLETKSSTSIFMIWPRPREYPVQIWRVVYVALDNLGQW